MRIRKCASRLLGSAYFNAQPEAPRPSLLPPTSPAAYGPVNGGGSAAASSEGICELNRSPWDMTSEVDALNPTEDPFDSYFVHIISRHDLVFSSFAAEEDEKMEVEDKSGKQLINEQKVAKKMKQDGEKKVVKAKGKEEDANVIVIEEGSAGEGKQAKKWFCKRKDGRNWHCRETVGCPNVLCDHHLKQSRSYYKPTSEKVAAAYGTASASSKPAPAKASVIGSKSDPAKTSVISCKSAPAKASVIGSNSKSASAKDSGSSKSGPASAASNSKAVSLASALTSPKPRKRKSAGDGLGQDYIYYDAWVSFRGKQCGGGGGSNHPEANSGVKEERSQQEANGAPKPGDDNKDDDDENDLSDIAEIAGGDEESDDDYVGSGMARAGSGKGKMDEEKARKRVKARSLKSLL